MLIRRDNTFGFNSAQLGWLEGRLYDLFDVAKDAKLHNADRPGDETLPPYGRQMLELSLVPIRRLLRVVGHDPKTADDEPPAGRRTSSKRFYGVTVADLITGGFLSAGDRLVATNGAWPALATVNADGTIAYAGTDYASPSAAATAVKGGPANGWEFWALDAPDGQVPLAVLRRRLPSGAEHLSH